jgi:hypothetical protein
MFGKLNISKKIKAFLALSTFLNKIKNTRMEIKSKQSIIP